MNALMTLVVVVQILSALGMIVLVLLQHGKGADMGASFGSGASGTLFGATGSANVLSRTTAVLAGVFFICTLSLAYMSTNNRAPAANRETILDKPAASAPASEKAASGAALIPGQIPATPALPAAPASSAPKAKE
jgi:preprotein translocase subunit SecG